MKSLKKDIKLKKAITKRSGNNGCNTSNVFEWIEMNKSSLINTFNHISQKYRTEINILKGGVTLTFDLIPRENNKLADTLCRKAGKLVNKKDINTQKNK